MKNTFARLFILALLVGAIQSCSKDESFDTGEIVIQKESNRMLMLKVDYLTLAFEGGTELFFDSNIESDTIPMTIDFESPGDFGGITLSHIPTNDTIFSGTIIWMGLGEREYPEMLQSANFFDLDETIADIPIIEDVQQIEPIPDPSTLGGINISGIWSNLSGLEAVQYYQENNAAIAILFYTPSVGAGDPEDWDYYVMLYL